MAKSSASQPQLIKIQGFPRGGEPIAVEVQSPVAVEIQPAAPDPSNQPNVLLFELIRRGAKAIDFNEYEKFVETALCDRVPTTLSKELNDELNSLKRPGGCFTGLRAYEYLRDVTDIFVMSQAAAVWPDCATATRTKPGDPPEFNFTKAEALDVTRRFYDSEKVTPAELNETGRNVEEGEGVLVATGDTIPPGNAPLHVLPFLRAIRRNLGGVSIKNGVASDANCSGVLRCRLQCPLLIELIWSYWMEQAMLVQALAAISLRFQNRRSTTSDPLARMEVTYLRPLTNLLWGYVQHEHDRLSVQRRALEYQHAYGLVISGRAIPSQLTAAEPRPRFLEAFHILLREADRYYRALANTMYRPDAFRVLNALKELHLILSEGMHNQYGDLPSTSRAEMLMQQFILARPEMRDFLGGRSSVTYPQPWMPHLETTRHLFGWADASVRHYYELATLGEQLLLSVRFWQWDQVINQQDAAAWLTFWKSEIQSYIHAYRVVTGVDLSVEEVREAEPVASIAAQPSDLIIRRRAAALPARVQS